MLALGQHTPRLEMLHGSPEARRVRPSAPMETLASTPWISRNLLMRQRRLGRRLVFVLVTLIATFPSVLAISSLESRSGQTATPPGWPNHVALTHDSDRLH